ncbi:MAG: hypothetical protein M1815_001775 [Lichina confinis]|nr:MAG: hypothetical protein M1815_001775 [Lichina confinis]
MVAQYTVFGRQVGSHYLSMATLGTTFGLSYLALRKKSPAKEQTPATQASNSDEEAFIKEFLRSAEAEGTKQKH